MAHAKSHSCFSVVILFVGIFTASLPSPLIPDDVDPGGNNCKEVSPNMSYSDFQADMQNLIIPTANLSQEAKVDLIIGISSNLLSMSFRNISGVFVFGNSETNTITVMETISQNLTRLSAVKKNHEEIVIANDNERYSLTHVKSKAIVPKYILNTENNISFFGCPGFKEGHGADNIASMYVVNTIFEKVTSAKFLFVTNFSSVTTDNSGLEFDRLTSHASRVVLNMIKFANSIALIVTKINVYSEMEDNDILFEVVAFLWNFHSNLNNQLARQVVGTRKWDFHRRKVQFVEAILQTDENGQHFKIAVMKNPIKYGTLSEMNYFVTMQRKLTDVYMNKLVYTAVNSSEFGFVSQFRLSGRIQNKIRQKIVPRIIAGIESDTLNAFDNVMKKYRADFEQKLSSITNKTTGMQEVQNLVNLLKVVEDVSISLMRGDQIAQAVTVLFDALQYRVPESYLNQVTNRENVLKFYQKITTVSITEHKFENTLNMVRNHLLSMKDILLVSVKNMPHHSQVSPLLQLKDVILIDSAPATFLKSDAMAVSEFDEEQCTILDPPAKVVLESGEISTPTKTPEEILQEILNQGMDQLSFERNQKAAVLVLGNTGSGKTTLTQTINGNLSQLHAVLTSSKQPVIIDDLNRIGLPTTKSKTLVPEYVVNPENNVAFYDCPGFDDNRGAETDIAAMYFVNTVTENVNRVKFLFTVTYSSTVIGNDRSDFGDLVKHAAQFLVNMSKFSDSIGLIVTKVDNFSRLNGKYVSDTIIMGGIKEFLQEFLNTVQKEFRKLKKGENQNELALTQRKIEFLEAILQQDENGELSRIGFLRNPFKCGPFSTMPHALVMRKEITDLYMTNLQYEVSSSTDFGFTLKDETLLKITSDFVPNIIDSIETTAEQVLANLLTDYKTDFETEFSGEFQTQKLALQKLYGVISNINQPKFTVEKNEISQIIKDLFGTVGYPVPESYMNETKRNENLLKFYARVSTVSMPSLSLNTSVLHFRNQIRHIKETCQLSIQNVLVPQISTNIQQETDQVITGLKTKYLRDFEKDFTSNISMRNAILRLKTVHGALQNLKLKKTEHGILLEDIPELFRVLQYPVPEPFYFQAKKQDDIIRFYENLTNFTFKRANLDSSFSLLQTSIQTLKDNTVLQIQTKIVPKLNADVQENISQAFNGLIKNYVSDFEKNFTNQRDMRSALLKLESIHANLDKFKLTKSESKIRIEEMPLIFQIMRYPVPEGLLDQIKQQDDLHSFYENVTGLAFISPSIDLSFGKLQHQIWELREKTWKQIENVAVPATISDIIGNSSKITDEGMQNFEQNVAKEFNIESRTAEAQQKLISLSGRLLNFSLLTSPKAKFSQQFQSLLEIVEYQVPEANMRILRNLEELLSFYESLTGSRSNRPSLQTSVTKMQSRIQSMRESKQHTIQNTIVPNLIAEIRQKMRETFDELVQSYTAQFENQFSNELYIGDALADLNSIYTKIGSYSSSGDTSSTLFSDISAVFKIMQFPVPEDFMTQLKDRKRQIVLYANITKITFQIPSFDSTLFMLQSAVRSLKEKTVQSVKSTLFPKISSQIIGNLTEIISALESDYMAEFHRDLGRLTMSSKHRKVNEDYSNLEILSEKWKESELSSATLSSEIRLIYSELHFAIPIEQKELLDEVTRLETTLNTLEQAFPSELRRPYGAWLRSPTSFISKLGEVQNWYEFVIRVEQEFQRYETQRMLNKKRQWDTMELIQQIRPEFAPLNIQQIWGKLRSDDVDRLLLEEIIDNASSPTTVECPSPTKALITGNYVRFSDFISNPSTLPCSSSTQEIVVFASEIVFFDSNISAKGKGLTIKVIANTWKMIGNVNIELSGSNGRSWNTPAQSGTLSNLNGEAGKPGEHGGNGGNFYGIFLTISNDDYNISVDGGDGGNGQDGGNGLDAPRGRDAEKSDFPTVGNYKKALQEHRFSTLGYVKGSWQWHEIAGKRIPGGNGGDGGSRGVGGYHGYIDIFQVQGNKIQFTSHNGSPGTEGKGGNSGTGGLRGRYMGGNWRHKSYWDEKLWEPRDAPDNERAPDGRKGRDGENSYGNGESPREPINYGITSPTILAFKQFILESENPVGRKFVRMMDEDTVISNL